MRRVLPIVVVLLCSSVVLLGQAERTAEHWVGAWSTALVVAPPAVPAPPPAAGRGQAPPQGGPAAPAPAGAPAPGTAARLPPGPPGPPPAQGPPPVRSFSNQTLRLIVHPTLGGNRFRVVLSNNFGTAPLVVGAANVALRDKDAAIVAKSSRGLKFSGSASTTIPAGAIIVSDPVDLAAPAGADVAIDLYVPGDTAASGSPVTMHTGANQTSYISASGNFVGSESLPVAATTPSWFLLARVEVVAPPATGAVVTLGDSITDGTRSTPNTNNRWPDLLAKRLGSKFAVLNAGIAGNRVLLDNAGPNALARFDRDVLSQTGVTHVIVLEGINDIGQARTNPLPSASDLITAHRQLIVRAHARGLKIFGATLTPFEGAGYFTAEGEAKRAALNEWIRTSREYDGVIDFDAAVRDPNRPTKFLAEFQSGDNLHPSDAGYQAMANAIDLSLFGLTQTSANLR